MRYKLSTSELVGLAELFSAIDRAFMPEDDEDRLLKSVAAQIHVKLMKKEMIGKGRKHTLSFTPAEAIAFHTMFSGDRFKCPDVFINNTIVKMMAKTK